MARRSSKSSRALTGVTVAASTDATGAAAKGGDWTLERGAVDAAAAYFDGGRLEGWQHTAALGNQERQFMDHQEPLMERRSPRRRCMFLELDRSNKLSRIQDMFQDDEEFPEDENVGGVMAALDRALR